MRYTHLGLAITLIISMSITGAWAGTIKSKTPPKAPEGWVYIEEVDLAVFQDEPEYLFHKAREIFFKRDAQAAATEIRKGTVFLKLEAARASTKGREALLASVHELEKLADAVEKGTVASVKELDHSFARAHNALTEHPHLKATESWAKNEPKKTGHYLKAAATHLENAISWSGHKLESGVKKFTNGTRVLAGKMIEGTGWVPKEIGKGIEEIGIEIQKLGQKIEPAKE